MIDFTLTAPKRKLDMGSARAIYRGMVEFSLFLTEVGTCAVAWGPAGIRTVLLPESSEQRTRARLLRRLPRARQATPPASIQAVIDDIVALLQGAPRDLRQAQLDLSGIAAFEQRVYEVARRIEPGCTLSYGEVAARCGDPAAARAVGQALGSNPFPIIVPCHRVLAAGGRSGGFSAPGGTLTKLRLLQLEGWPRDGARRDAATPANLSLPL
jgi:methylated-DNA-[protein]-cysteine S-methyltransferase